MPVGRVQDYASQSDARTLHEAHQIRSNKKRHAKAMTHLKNMGTEHKAAHTHEKAAMASMKSAKGAETNAEGAPGIEEAQ